MVIRKMSWRSSLRLSLLALGVVVAGIVLTAAVIAWKSSAAQPAESDAPQSCDSEWFTYGPGLVPLEEPGCGPEVTSSSRPPIDP